MITTKYVRDHLLEIRQTLKDRNSKFQLDELLELDERRRKTLTELQELQAKLNKSSLEISDAKKKGLEIKAKIAALSELKSRIESIKAEVPKIEERIDALIWNVPNTLDRSVPIGNPPEGSKTIKSWARSRTRRAPITQRYLQSSDYWTRSAPRRPRVPASSSSAGTWFSWSRR